MTEKLLTTKSLPLYSGSGEALCELWHVCVASTNIPEKAERQRYLHGHKYTV